MTAQNGNWNFRTLSNLTIGIILAALITPFVIIVQIPLWLFGLQRANRTPEEVASYLKDFMDGTEGDHDWDDFEAVPIKDPRLDAISVEAMAIRLPIDPSGHAKLAELLTRAEELAAHKS